MYARDVMMRKPLGKMAMKHRLLQKGLARDTVETTLNTIYDEQYENTAALELARKRLPRLKRLDQIKQKQRISSYLAGRGFAWETISEVLQELYKD
jgi:SOS response regulatory protein OraA/RecX